MDFYAGIGACFIHFYILHLIVNIIFMIKTTIDIDEAMMAEIDVIAAENGLKRIDIIRLIFKYYLENKDTIKLV